MGFLSTSKGTRQKKFGNILFEIHIPSISVKPRDEEFDDGFADITEFSNDKSEE